MMQDKLVQLLAATAGSQTPASLRRLLNSASSDTFVASIKHIVFGKGGSSEEQRRVVCLLHLLQIIKCIATGRCLCLLGGGL